MIQKLKKPVIPRLDLDYDPLMQVGVNAYGDDCVSGRSQDLRFPFQELHENIEYDDVDVDLDVEVYENDDYKMSLVYVCVGLS